MEEGKYLACCVFFFCSLLFHTKESVALVWIWGSGEISDLYQLLTQLKLQMIVEFYCFFFHFLSLSVSEFRFHR